MSFSPFCPSLISSSSCTIIILFDIFQRWRAHIYSRVSSTTTVAMSKRIIFYLFIYSFEVPLGLCAKPKSLSASSIQKVYYFGKTTASSINNNKRRTTFSSDGMSQENEISPQKYFLKLFQAAPARGATSSDELLRIETVAHLKMDWQKVVEYI